MGKRNAETDVQSETPNKTTKFDSFDVSNISSYCLSGDLVDGTVLTDLSLKDWRIGRPIGKGSFGEIFLASDNIYNPVTSQNAKYVVKIEPHSNGPLFVEIHCLLNTAKRTDGTELPPGMPEYIASGSHYFQNERYRFLILHRYKKDLNSLVKNSRMDSKCVIMLADQILNTLENLHDKGYAHSDIKAGNLMVGDFFDVQENVTNNKRKKLAKNVDNIVLASTPVRKCSRTKNIIGKEKTTYLRPTRNVVYKDHSDDEDFVARRHSKKRKTDDPQFYFTIQTQHVTANHRNISIKVDKSNAFTTKKEPPFNEQKIYLIDFGLASKFNDTSGQHKPFCMDQRRAHDGTLEFTSRDAHMGAHARRSDLEVLGYNLVYWSQGFLPWKDDKLINQPEQVHRMKEYFMTDVKKMIPLIYGDDCPAFLGEFLDYVNTLTYDERPDYDRCRSIFRDEFKKMGFDVEKDLKKLNAEEITKLCSKISPECSDEIAKKVANVKQIIKLGQFYHYKDSTWLMKSASPKNLRSKRDSKANLNKDTPTTGKKEKRFSWSDILSTDPDQIARQRAEKEYDRNEHLEESAIKYTGCPTYAILEIENRLKNISNQPSVDDSMRDFHIEGYTKPMMDILRKRQSNLFRDLQDCMNPSVEQPAEKTNKDEDTEVDEQEEEEDEQASSSDDDSGNDDNEEEENDENEENSEFEPEIAEEKKLPLTKQIITTRRGRRVTKQISVEEDSDFNEAEADDEPKTPSPASKRQTRRRKTRVTVRRPNNESNEVVENKHDIESEQENVVPQHQKRIKRRGIESATPVAQSSPVLQQATVIPKQPTSQQNLENNEGRTRLRRFIKKSTRNVNYHDSTAKKRKSARKPSVYSNSSASSHPMTDSDDNFVEKDNHKDEDFVHDDETCSSVNSNASSGSADTGTGSDDTYGRRYIQRKMVQNKEKKSPTTLSNSFKPAAVESDDAEEDLAYSPVRVRVPKKVGRYIPRNIKKNYNVNEATDDDDDDEEEDTTYGRKYSQSKLVQNKRKRSSAALSSSFINDESEEDQVYSPVARVRAHKKVVVAHRRGICLRKTHILRNRVLIGSVPRKESGLFTRG